MADSQPDAEPTEAEPVTDLPPLLTLSLQLLQTIKTAQAQHGLRHNDYKRYRQYCARKLRRLYKAMKLTHGRGKYLAKRLEPANVTDVGHLMIPLIGAERCWSQAMEFRGELEKESLSYKRQHMLRRFSKAAKLAAELADLASKRCNDRTVLEAEAYSLWMQGTLFFEKEQWEPALAKLSRTRQVYQELAKLGSLEQQAVLNKQLDDLAAPINFCKYKLKTNDANASLPVPDSPSAKTIKSKLESLAARPESQKAGSGGGVAAIAWRGNTCVVAAERVRLSLAQAQDISKQVDDAQSSGKPSDETLALYDRMLAAFNEAKGLVRHSISAGRASDASASLEELKALDVTVTGTQLERTIERGHAQLKDILARYESGQQSSSCTLQRVPKKKKAKLDKSGPPKAEDVVRAFDALISHVKELSEVAARLGGTAGEVLIEECTAKRATLQAARCFFVGRSYLAAAKPVEAHGLFERTLERVQQAQAAWDDLEHPDTDAEAELRHLKEQAQAWRCVAHAEAVALVKQQELDAQQGMEDLAIEARPAAAQYLLDNPDTWESFAGGDGKPPRLFPIPPRLAQIAARPFMLDSAEGFVKAPSLEHRVKKEESKSTFSRIFAWGAKK